LLSSPDINTLSVNDGVTVGYVYIIAILFIFYLSCVYESY
jgi:hypothetical protein